MRQKHSLERDQQRLLNRAAGTVIDLTCPDCDGKRVAQLVYVSRNRVDLVDRWPGGINNAHWVTPQEAIDCAQRVHQGQFDWTLNPGAWIGKEHRYENEPVESSTVLDEPTSEPVEKQEALPPAAIASTTAASLCAMIAAQLEATARQSYPDDLVEIDRELMQVQALREIAKWANEQAIRKAQRAARKPGATLSKVGAALGVSRQRVHQLLYPDGRY